MERLIAELQRLYFLPDQQGTPPVTPEILQRGAAVSLDPVGPDGRARLLALDFARASDWEPIAALCQGVEEDLELPAPAVSVSGGKGLRVWFSLAEPVFVAEARDFLEGLRRRYLADLPAAALAIHPGSGPLALIPALEAATGKWAAFIDPAMGSMFAEEPWLEMAPNPARQADLLAGFSSIPAGDFRRALLALAPRGEPDPGAGEGSTRPEPGPGGHFDDPKSFLLAVMNDPAAGLGHRIEAAKALLPYFKG